MRFFLYSQDKPTKSIIFKYPNIHYFEIVSMNVFIRLLLYISKLTLSQGQKYSRTIESLYEELVKEGILVQYPKVKVADYMGEYR